MKKTKVEPPQESLVQISENRLMRLNQKVKNLDHNGLIYVMGNGQWFSAYRWLLKHSQLFMIYNLVNPLCSRMGRNFARSNIKGRGESKKQTILCNAVYRGSKHALIRKDADLLYGVLLYEWRHNL
jgi:hypothetical protein